MGKKAKTKSGKEKAHGRKVDKNELPPPPPPVEEEMGSAKLLDEPPSLGAAGYRALDREGYDDGGVADLTLVIDLDDSVLRRKRGDNAYFSAAKADLLPRVTTGQMAELSRRDQKVQLAKLLFSEDSSSDQDNNPSEVYTDSVDGQEDKATIKAREEKLATAKYALRLSRLLREPALSSLSLTEVSKRYLKLYGKAAGESALRCVDKAIEIAADGFYDGDDIDVEYAEVPKIDEKYEKNATYPGLGNALSLKYQSKRVSHLCLRTAFLHRGNALAALGKEEEAREAYRKVLEFLESEPRCSRLDWERASALVNIGNSYSRQGDYEKADIEYTAAERLARDHLEIEHGNKLEGMGLMILTLRARAFALKKANREDEGKNVMKDVIAMQMKLNAEQDKKKQEAAAATATAVEEPASSPPVSA